VGYLRTRDRDRVRRRAGGEPLSGAAGDPAAVVRLERPEDRPESLEIERLAFGGDEEVDIVVAVRDEDGSFALVAEEPGALVGHVQLSRAWIGPDPILALGPIGVLPDRQGRGIGRALLDEAAEEARRRNESAIILLGDPRFYPRFGYRPAASLGLRNPFAGVGPDGFEIREEDFMILPLDEVAEAAFSGAVRWHPAFGQPASR
jgi:predicted N-acetyltransferase YhbS